MCLAALIEADVSQGGGPMEVAPLCNPRGCPDFDRARRQY